MPKSTGMKITCPYCNKSITLDEVLMSPIEDKIRKNFESELKNSEKKYLSEIKKIKSELTNKEKEIIEIEESMKDKLKSEFDKHKKQIEEEAKTKAEKSIGLEMKDLQEQLKEKSDMLEKAQKQELELRKEKRKIETEKKNFELEMNRKLDDERKKIYEDALKKASDEHTLKNKEKQKTIDDLTKQITDLKRKAEQGSQKLQGEVLELELEEVLQRNFNNDDIEPIVSGAKGADIFQKVKSNNGKLCGSILIESKQAKNWSDTWISKLKKDQREAKADIGVLVSTVLPDGIDNFAFIEGIVVVHFKSVIPVILLLRNQLFEVARTKSFNTGKNEKMEALYTYLTGTEFRQKVETIVEAFANMMDDLQKEKRAMTKIWSKREKQIEQAFYGIAGMYGGLQGIIGSSLPEIKSLNMPEFLLEHHKENNNYEEENS